MKEYFWNELEHSYCWAHWKTICKENWSPKMRNWRMFPNNAPFEEQQRPVKQSGKSLLANETENGNTCNCLRRGKTQKIQLRSVLVQHFIGWQGGASFPDNLRVRLCKTNAIWDYFGRSVTNFLDAFPWFKLYPTLPS